jgi:hypothetical protein
VLVAALPAAAQTKGRFILGPAINGVYPLDGDVASDISIGGFFKRRPKPGFSPALGLNWFRVDLRRHGQDRLLGKIQVRPFLAGVGYTVVKGRFSYGAAALAGYSFNKITTTEDVIDNDHGEFDVKNCLVWKLGVNADYALGSRFVVTSGLGFAFLDPKIRLTVSTPGGTVTRESGSWKTNAFVWQTGIGFAF